MTSDALVSLPVRGAGMATRRGGGLRSRRILGKLAGAVIVVWGVVTLTFLMSRVVAPDPTTLLVPPQATQAHRAAVRHELGLDSSLVVQYGHFLRNLAHGDLGESFSTGLPVTKDLSQRLPATIELGLLALVVGTLVGVLVGVFAAIHADSVIDHGLRAVVVTGLAMPQFWLGLSLLSVFFVQLGVLPAPIGRLPVGVDPPPTITHLYLVDALLTGQWSVFVDSLRQLILPAATIGAGVFSPIARVTRTAMVEALSSDYVRTARSLGFSPARVHFIFALRNALLPIITMTANAVAFALSGAVLVEGVFGWPGIGQYALTAIQQSDFPGLQGFVLYVAVLYVLIYVVVDILYTFADPRLRR
ncbi:ABC transporter permease [Frankia sp. AgB32]|uniref:ABC transporter permease n=1 Tax=Frankia sp. AgB32 TaxID=631119 RepID=UPI00200D20B5|nr:ABC transporter permease [Frankia sp. AgB32]MCK9897841.1 ABC transporter permease [Frankia sp. AgB32]